MAAEVDKVRPNIRIEIHNNLSESMAMECEEFQKSENEEGEIIDDKDTSRSRISIINPKPAASNKMWPSTKGIFSTGINIFDKEEQEKLQERAKRFSLKPEEIHVFTDDDLQRLHESLGITVENENLVRFETVHMLGTNEMNTEDVLEYYAKYAPVGIEWINEESCNVVWSENISAARAMHYTSKVVRGMPARSPYDPYAKEFLDDVEESVKKTGQSILLKNENREVELKDDDEILSHKKVDLENSVDISEIKIPIPPGFWRLGQKHPKAKCLLVRFGLVTDKKPYKAEKFNKYFKKYGTATFSGTKGVISESKKKEIRSIFERNKDLNQDKNPWGSLAKSWDQDVQFREREPVMYDAEPKIEIKNPKILARLGVKRKLEESENLEAENEEKEAEKEPETKKTKIPRMRMYADEEEEKLKRKKLLQTIKLQTEKISKEEKNNQRDLRNVLGITNKRTVKEVTKHELDIVDLGSKLKNRSKKMVFAVERDDSEFEECESKEQVQSDIRCFLSEKAQSPVYKRKISPSIQKASDRRRETSSRHRISRRNSEKVRRSPIGRQRTPERTLHSDRMYSSRSRYSRTRNYSEDQDERRYSQKPKSKVAVVIRTQKRPTVASTIWSRVKKTSDSEKTSSDSDSESEDSEKSSSSNSSSESDSESEDDKTDGSSSASSSKKRHSRSIGRPGFDRMRSRLSEKLDHRSPLKITMTNDRFRK